MADAILHYVEGAGTAHYIPRTHIQRLQIAPQMDGTVHATITVPPGPDSVHGTVTDVISLGYHDPDTFTAWAEAFFQAMSGEIIRVPKPVHREQ